MNQQGVVEAQEYKNNLIRELIQIGHALEQEGKKLVPDVDAAKRSIEKMKGVGDELKEQGEDIADLVAQGVIPEINLGNLTDQTSLGQNLAPIQNIKSQSCIDILAS